MHVTNWIDDDRDVKVNIGLMVLAGDKDVNGTISILNAFKTMFSLYLYHSLSPVSP